MNIFVGNLNDMATTSHLSNLFHQFGKVISIKIIRDAFTGRSMGYGFVEMDKRSGITAIKKLNSLFFMNHFLQINEASV